MRPLFSFTRARQIPASFGVHELRLALIIVTLQHLFGGSLDRACRVGSEGKVSKRPLLIAVSVIGFQQGFRRDAALVKNALNLPPDQIAFVFLLEEWGGIADLLQKLFIFLRAEGPGRILKHRRIGDRLPQTRLRQSKPKFLSFKIDRCILDEPLQHPVGQTECFRFLSGDAASGPLT